MKEALVSSGPKVQIVDSPIPKPQANQVLIKVVVSGSNPKDWKRGEANEQPWNTGDDIAGTIHAVGPQVQGFKPGDRVAAFHEMQEPHGSFAEYAIAPAHTTFHIPDRTSFEEASTIPLAALTAADGLYQSLRLPLPFNPTPTPTPMIIYGASSAVGSFAIQFALQSNIHPLICIAGAGASHVESLLDSSKGDEVLDYRVGPSELLVALKAAVAKSGTKAVYGVDAICAHDSYKIVAQALAPGGKIAYFSPAQQLDATEGVEKLCTYVGTVHGQSLLGPPRQEATGTKVGDKEFGEAMLVLIRRGLEAGWFKGHPFEVREGGLAGVECALKDLKDGKVSAKKLVFRIADTQGVGA